MSKNRNILTVSGIIIILIIGVFVWFRLSRQQQVVPKEISSKIKTAIYLPPKAKGKTFVLSESIEYREQTKILVFDVNWEGKKLTFTQQETPESFVDIPQAYDALITSLQPVYTFESINGKVTITEPKEFGGEEAGVLNSKGTLLFIRSKDKLAQEVWKQIFSDLQILHK